MTADRSNESIELEYRAYNTAEQKFEHTAQPRAHSSNKELHGSTSVIKNAFNSSLYVYNYTQWLARRHITLYIYLFIY